MKKILFLNPTLTSGGAERQMVTLAPLLKKKGYKISFLCFSDNHFFQKELDKYDIPVVWKITNNKLLIIYNCIRYIKKNKFDVVISFLSVPNFINNLSRIFGAKNKIITGERSAWCDVKSLRNQFFNFMRRFSDYIVGNSNRAVDLWRDHYPQYDNKLRTIYNIINFKIPNIQYTPLKCDKVNILVAATYQYLKNPLLLILAINNLTKEEQNKIHIDWYGRKVLWNNDSRCYLESQQMIDKFKLNNIICLHDNIKNIYDYMSQADVIGLFSQSEGLPNVVCEGLMLGKPIIMTKVSDYNVLVENDINGYLCESFDVESIVNALRKIINCSKDKLLTMGVASKQRFENIFNTENLVNKWVDIIEK